MIEMNGICKTYGSRDTKTSVLKDFNIRIADGEFVVLFGRSGCGKTTLLNIIGLLDQADSGDYYLDGQSVVDMTEKERANTRNATLGYIFQGFYLLPDFSKITFSVVVAAMNQAFFTLSIGIGSMAIFGSYIGQERSLMGESVNVILLDTFVALMAGLIIFPACTSLGLEVTAGPALLFNTMGAVFNSMAGGRIWGTIFFLFMTFAAFSTVLAVCENILACIRELTGWNRKKGSVVTGIIVFLSALTTALGYSVLSGFQPFAPGSAWLDFWDFIVSTNLLPIGALIMTLFCVSDRFGWGWENFKAEANAGKGLKVQDWMKPVFQFVVPIVVIALYIIGLK